MPLPIDTILVRHGQSEGNKANKASRKSDNRFFTPEFRDKHSRVFRLTNRGIGQAEAAGRWLRENIPMPLDRFYVSDYIRAKETAAYLALPGACWRAEFHLRERDMALMDNCPDDEKKRLFALEDRQFNIDPFLSFPAGGGESIANLCQRLKTTMVAHWARECSDKRIVAVCHGHVMRALQLEFEDLGHDDFIRLDQSETPQDKLRNCQIVWYTRRDPETQKLFPNLVAVRSICPLNSDTGLPEDFGWRRINRNRYSNEDLLREVQEYPRHIS
ncbi:MAG: hypothetical protein A3J46_00605 [Candidatus Yanofskybacteria bacterium RIFCSPHIGHO2_02_FULL_41_11]|uniref:Uncharacterized protein n=1 Tax=Candidatus Yanofskybacteria bacterium RIFCSPHIGHO2_02_FULL_41_11 TaxID=1802675 RepID=A0A1F8FAW5_9BACT|nr:MAG: hypothetical protein A3J46_00605 [Candidatus Yanofskybacteria bacterium RIFCSPHIGHO2_02_FULL_41_11]